MFCLAPLVDEFRIINWVKIKSDMEFYENSITKMT